MDFSYMFEITDCIPSNLSGVRACLFSTRHSSHLMKINYRIVVKNKCIQCVSLTSVADTIHRLRVRLLPQYYENSVEISLQVDMQLKRKGPKLVRPFKKNIITHISFNWVQLNRILLRSFLLEMENKPSYTSILVLGSALHVSQGDFYIRASYAFPRAVYSRTAPHTHFNKGTANICSHITTNLIIHPCTIIDYFSKV